MSLKFGTSGLRGLSVDLEGPATALYATAFARHLLTAGIARPGDEVLIGRDFRDSSPAIAAIAIAALGRAGLCPRDCGTLPTPALALLGLARKAACLMVTGSHIPADRNGIKFYRPDGEIDKADEAAITAAAAALRSEGADLPATPEAADDLHDAAMALYTARNHTLLPERALAGLRVGVYQHSTVARDLLVSVLAHYGADVVALGRSERFIPVDTEAVSAETIALLEGWAVQHGLAAIVSADGDGDRPLVTDETGTPLRGDLVGLIASRFLGATVIATPVTSNSGIEAAVSGRVLRTRVGSPFVIAAMNEAVAAGETAVAGFEANGGTLTATPFAVNGLTLAALPTRDSLMPVLAVLALAAAEDRPLSAIAAGFALPAAASDRLENMPVETSAALMAELRSGAGPLAAFLAPIGVPAKVSDLDGLRVTLEDGSVIHFRPSGNAPEMRCYVEAKSETAAADLLAAGLERVRAWATSR
ncbi:MULTISPECIES: phosphomannomutase [unclassified Shinella]|uniref:phosphomannomutase n=1 Tax=unclassified Shinella TaxID=2643062 RepID=UPI00225D7949|nr:MULTISPECIES: phosphomannomutase [unclassified Shinella]MCO5137346.1 phosphomannomutase [Shinella sp.]MDC7257478.1 phosphomannomutase [Shinella sp. YE25]CAI0340379.1 Phosphomannomutase [Rhizobiaceae bacterium]CAK7258746.1 Phosphomannomutase [Shinella sp. WSC3-e]